MKTIAPALQALLAGEQVRTAICWTVEKKTGGVLRGTEHDRNIVISTGTFAGTYLSHSNISGSDVRGTSDMSVDNMEVHGADADAAADGITAAEIEAGVVDGARVTVFLCDWSNPDAGQTIIKRGYMGAVSGDSDHGQKNEVRGLAQLLAQVIGRVLSDTCDVREFGDSRCKYDVDAITENAVVTVVTSNRRFSIEFPDSPAPSWTQLPPGGKVTFTSGENDGFSKEVKSVSEDGIGLEVQLYEEMAGDVQSGDTLTFRPGCDFQYSTCKAYDNLLNFRGDGIFVPGRDAVMRGPSASGECVFDLPDVGIVLPPGGIGGGGGSGGIETGGGINDPGPAATPAPTPGSSTEHGGPHTALCFFGPSGPEYTAEAMNILPTRQIIIMLGDSKFFSLSGGRVKQDLIDEIKGDSTVNSKIYQYIVANEQKRDRTKARYNEWWDYCTNNSKWLYQKGTSGAKTVSSFSDTQDLVNISSYAGDVMAEFANQMIERFLEAASSAVLYAPGLDGFFVDNVFYKPRAKGGSPYDYDRDGTSDSNTAAIRLALRTGTKLFYTTMAAAYPNLDLGGNTGEWHNAGTIDEIKPLDGLLSLGMNELGIGLPYSVETHSGTQAWINNVKFVINCLGGNKRIVCNHINVAANGSDPYDSTPRRAARYSMGLGGLFTGVFIGHSRTIGHSPDVDTILTMDEMHGGALNQWGWMGKKKDADQIANRAGLPAGVYACEWENGLWLVNKKGNPSVTITKSQLNEVGLNGPWKFIPGTQDAVNNGATFNSVTLAPRDARCLMRT